MEPQGTCDPRFEAVRTEFERNLTERGEVGASVCVTFEGRTVVDLWGGVADRSSGRLWTGDTMAVVMSSTKGALAWCANLLADSGQLGLDDPVARYWPEFAKHGKDGVTIRMALCHTAGVPHVRAWLPDGALADWDLMVGIIADEEPYWEPGTRQGYHALTYGYIVGEVIRRVTGQLPGRFFAREVAGPLGLDAWIGLPVEEHHRVAPLILPPAPEVGEPVPGLMARVFGDPASILGSVFLNNGGFTGASDQPLYYSADIPAGNGITHGRGLAGLYRPLANGGEGLISESAISKMGAVNSASLVDATLGCRMRFTLGFHKAVDNRTDPNVPDFNCFWSEDAFGHGGNGGSLGFADPRARISFGYVMNQFSRSLGPDERSQSLIDATYRSLGYRSRESGVWA